MIESKFVIIGYFTLKKKTILLIEDLKEFLEKGRLGFLKDGKKGVDLDVSGVPECELIFKSIFFCSRLRVLFVVALFIDT